MTTFLAQNQFISDSGTPPSTAVPDTAAADQVAPQVAAAEPLSVSPGELLDLYQRDGEIEPSVMLAWAPRCTEPHNDVGALGYERADDEALYWQLRRADNPFTRDLAEIPDPHALFDAIEPPPLFLQRAAG